MPRGSMKEGLETLGFQIRMESWSSRELITMLTILTTTSSFPSSIVKLCLTTKSRSRSPRSQWKLLKDMILNSKRLAMIKTTYTSWLTLLPNTVGARWFACSKASLLECSSSNFHYSRKNSGVESSGVMDSTWLQAASGETGVQWRDTLKTKGRRGVRLTNSNYSLNDHAPVIPRGLPQGR